MINLVTITGADNSIEPKDLLPLTEKYPFVEWAILVSRTSTGGGRFPTISWIKELQKIAPNIKLSCHLCGAYVREILMGNIDFIANELKDVWTPFQRVQINTHGVPHAYSSIGLSEVLSMYPEKEFIFQYDEVNKGILESMAYLTPNTNISALFDLSHGAGVLPKEWPDLLDSIKCGYAGGISPQNIENQIYQINKKVGDTDVWIDMETHVRSNNDYQFDLDKVERCLEISSKELSQLS